MSDTWKKRLNPENSFVNVKLADTVPDEEDPNLRHDVNYLRFLLESGLSEEEIVRIAKEQNPKLEVCFSEEACITQAKVLEPGKYLVMIS